MSFKDKVIKILTEEGLDTELRVFIEKVKGEILKGVGQEMLKQQEEQNKRFLEGLKTWEKLVDNTITEKVTKAVDAAVKEER